jgi:hypothetical protein
MIKNLTRVRAQKPGIVSWPIRGYATRDFQALGFLEWYVGDPKRSRLEIKQQAVV